jgi:hypothetical protein
MKEYNEENINCLAKIVVDSWDMKAPTQYAIDTLIGSYEDDEDSFNSDWKNFKSERFERQTKI